MEWSPGGDLTFVSDRNGWWNLYRQTPGGDACLCETPAEFGLPQWVFGMSTYAFVDQSTIACAYSSDGAWRLGLLDTDAGVLQPVPCRATSISSVRAEDIIEVQILKNLDDVKVL